MSISLKIDVWFNSSYPIVFCLVGGICIIVRAGVCVGLLGCTMHIRCRSAALWDAYCGCGLLGFASPTVV